MDVRDGVREGEGELKSLVVQFCELGTVVLISRKPFVEVDKNLSLQIH